MSEQIWLAAALLLSVTGMTALALSLEAHWEQVGFSGAVPKLALRLIGGVCLAASLAACLAADHLSMAALVWPMDLALAAAGVALVLSRIDRPARAGNR